MRILVTGGAGYVGCVLTRHLLLAGHAVTVVDTFDHGSGPLLHPSPGDFVAERADVADSRVVNRIMLSRQIEAVIHLAALVGYPACRENPVLARRTIVDGTRSIADLCFAHRLPLINASTGSVYGAVERLCTEETPCNPQSTYGRLKLEAEKEVEDARGVNLRFATLFGVSPCMRFDLLPNNFVWRAVKSGYIVIYNGNDRRTFLSVDDAARAYLATLAAFPEVSGKTFNVGDVGFNMTKLEMAKAIQAFCPFDLIESGGAADPDCRDYEVNYDSFLSATGFEAIDRLPDVLGQVAQAAKICDSRGPWRLSL
jgi:nucleoside-diphosphate-sugar epimerase